MDKDNIVLIEDDVPLSKMMAIFLADEQYNIIRCSNAREGLENIRTHIPALAILDLNLPDSRGIDTYYQISKSAGGIPVIVLTTDETKRAEALDSGANDFVMKPVRKDQVAEKINRLINI